MQTDVPHAISFCITDLDAGGAERALVQIVTRLDRELWTPTVISLSPEGELVTPLEKAGIPVHSLNGKSAKQLSILPKLAKILRQLKPELLQTFLFHANIAGRLAGRWAKVPCIVSGIRVAEKRSRFYLSLDRWTRRWVKHHVCVSEAVKTFSKQQGHLPESQLSVIPNGVDYDHFANAPIAALKQFGIPDKSEVIIAVGRLDHQKGSLLLLKAVESLLAVRPQTHLLYVGIGSLESALKERVASQKLESQVHFAGYHSDVAPFLKAATIFVLASRWEGMPNAVLEAMAAGIPIVATDVEGVRELITHEQSGLVIPVDDTDRLQDSLKSLLDSPEQQLMYRNKSQALSKERLTWDKIAGEYSSLYLSLLEIPKK